MRLARSGAFLVAVLALLGATPARAADRWVTTSDGVRLHLIDEGAPGAPPILFVPGWTMPAWIWRHQLDTFASRFHVAAMDPRGQGDSEAPRSGYTWQRRGEDIADVLRLFGPRRVLLVGWSLGVLDSLAYVHENGDAHLAGLVLVDNSVGEYPPPMIHAPARRRRPVERSVAIRHFVVSMFHRDPGPAYLDALTASALRTPRRAASELLAYRAPRSLWRAAVLSVRRPVLYIVTPRLAGQAASLAADDPDAETRVFPDAGHALFVDDARRFDATLADFIRRRVQW